MDYVPFVKCENPVTVYDRMGVPSFVPCHNCVACEVQKHDTLSRLLQVEEQRSKHCAFITLTYDEDSLPVADFGDLLFFDPHLDKSPDGLYYTPTIDNTRIRKDVEDGYYTVPRLRYYNKLFYSLEHYNLRRDLYKSKYSVCINASYEHDKVAFLYPRDLQLFMKRLRKYISFNYNEKVRYYAIGEYGTRSLRPHWHILLFYSSDELYRDFEDTVDLGTSSRPCETALFLCDLWQYGICSSANTDGKAYYYVSSYVNKSSEFPLLLDDFAPQKSYHSLFLGQVYQEEDVSRSLKNRDFENIGSTSVLSSDGSKYTVSFRRSLLSRLLPKFTDISFQDGQILRECLFSYLKTRKYGDSVLKQAYYIYECYINDYFPNPEIHRLCCLLARNCELVSHSDNESLLSAVTSVLYASKRFLAAAVALGIDYDEYFNIYCDYYKWLGLKTLRDNYQGLELSPRYSELYYSDFRIYGGHSVPINNQRDSVEFLNFKQSIYHRHDKNIKHRTISDKYKFLQQ